MARSSYNIDLIKQMAECDANYIRLLKLVPQLRAYLDGSFEELAGYQAGQFDEPEKTLEGTIISYCLADPQDDQGKVTVEIRVVEAFRYTSTLEIVQLPQLKQWMTNPSMLVRVYHDANTAEVISYQGHRNLQPRYPRPNPQMYHPDEKMQVNQFLGEWLTHCLNVGRSTKVPDLLFSS